MTQAVRFFLPPAPPGGRLPLAVLTLAASSVSLVLCAVEFMMPAEARRQLLVDGVRAPAEGSLLPLALAFAFGLPVAAALAIRLYGGRASERKLSVAAELSAPLVLSVFVPFLFDWQLAQAHTLSYLLVLTLFVLVGRRLLTQSFELWRRWREEGAVAATRLTFSLSHAWCFSIVLLCATAYAVYTGYFTILHHRQVATTAFDLGIYDNLMYNALHGRFFHSPVLFGPGNQNYLAGHAELAMVVFVPFYAIRPGPETMLIMQSFMFGFAALPLYLFGARVIGRQLALVVSVAYLFFAPLHGPHFYDFHWLPFQIFFHFWLYYSLAAKKTWLTVLSLLMLYAIREDIAVGLTFLGLFLFLTSIRPRFGLILAAVSASWFGFEKFVLMPRLGSWHFEGMYTELFADGRMSYGSVIQTLISNPIYALTTFIRSVKLQYGLHMMVPLALLPLSRLPFLLILIPPCVFTLMTTGYWPTTEISFQYTTHWIPYLFLTTVLAFAAMRRERAGESRRWAAACVLVVAMLSHSYSFGCLLQRESFKGGFGRIAFGLSEDAKERYGQLTSLLKRIPQSASVAATEAVNPHISTRLDAYAFRYDFGPVDYMLLSRYEIGSGDQRKIFSDQVNKYAYGLAGRAGEFFLFKRGPITPETRAAFGELGISVGEPSQ